MTNLELEILEVALAFLNRDRGRHWVSSQAMSSE